VAVQVYYPALLALSDRSLRAGAWHLTATAKIMTVNDVDGQFNKLLTLVFCVYTTYVQAYVRS